MAIAGKVDGVRQARLLRGQVLQAQCQRGQLAGQLLQWRYRFDGEQLQEGAHRDRKTAVLAEAAEDVLQGLQDRESARQARLAMLAPEVHRLRAETVADLALFAQVLGAVDREAGLSVHPSRQERVPRDVTTDGLLDAATAGVSLLKPSPISGPARGVLRDDGSDDGVREIVPRRLGMSSRSFGGNIDSWPREQRLPPGRV